MKLEFEVGFISVVITIKTKYGTRKRAALPISCEYPGLSRILKRYQYLSRTQNSSQALRGVKISFYLQYPDFDPSCPETAWQPDGRFLMTFMSPLSTVYGTRHLNSTQSVWSHGDLNKVSHFFHKTEIKCIDRKISSKRIELCIYFFCSGKID